MDDFPDTVRTGARQVAEQVRPASAAAVRARGERQRNRRTVGSIALAAVGAAVIGTAAFAAFGDTSGVPKTVGPGTARTSTPVAPHPSTPPPGSTPPAGVPNSSPNQPSTPSSQTTNPSSQTSDPSSQTSTSSSQTSSSPSTPAACTPAHLAITSSPWTGRTGHTIGIFLFHNTGSTTCRVSGYPRVSGLNEQGATTTVATDTLTGWAGTLSSVPTVAIPPGGYASAGVEWLNSTDGSKSCALVATFEVSLPSGGTSTRIAAGTPSPTDGPACASFQIHPIAAGFESDFFYPPYSPPA